jgi:hypothetical protein
MGLDKMCLFHKMLCSEMASRLVSIPACRNCAAPRFPVSVLASSDGGKLH